MPKVNVKFLASFRELAGTDEVQVEAGTPAEALTVLGLLDAIVEKTPLVAVNQHIVAMDSPLREGDEVALMPPMTGG